MPPHTYWDSFYQKKTKQNKKHEPKKQKIASFVGDVEKLDPLRTVAENGMVVSQKIKYSGRP